MTARIDSAARPATEDQGWPFLVQLAIAGLVITAIQAARPMVTYRAIDLGASRLEIGLVQSAFSILPVLTAVLLGRWVDRVGEIKILALGCVAVSVGGVITAASTSLATLAIGQLAMGFGLIGQAVAGQALVANRGSVVGRVRRYAWWSVAASLGQLVGPPIAALLVVGGGESLRDGTGLGAAGPASTNAQAPVFLFAAIASGAAVVLTLILPYRSPVRRATTTAMAPDARLLAAVGRVLRRNGMAPAMFMSIIVSASMDVLLAYLPAQGVESGLSVATVGALLSVRAAASLVSRVFLGRLGDAIGQDKLLFGSTALAAAGTLALPFTASVPVLFVLMSLIGLGLGLGQPMVVAWVANQSAPQERGLALGVRLTGNLGAQLVVPTVVGAIAGAAGLGAIWISMAVFLGLGAAVAWRAPLGEVSPARAEDATIPD